MEHLQQQPHYRTPSPTEAVEDVFDKMDQIDFFGSNMNQAISLADLFNATDDFDDFIPSDNLDVHPWVLPSELIQTTEERDIIEPADTIQLSMSSSEERDFLAPASNHHPPTTLGGTHDGVSTDLAAQEDEQQSQTSHSHSHSHSPNKRRSTDTTAEDALPDRKRQQRLARNRENAALSRWRKKANVENLERRIQELESGNAKLNYMLSCSSMVNNITSLSHIMRTLAL